MGHIHLIKNPNHFINSSSSSVDLIFSTAKSLLRDCGIDPSLYDTCLHGIISGKVKFGIPLSPPFHREIWDYRNANNEGIQRSRTSFNWKKSFQNKNIKAKIEIFTETLKIIFSNYILHEKVKFDYIFLIWMNFKITSALKKTTETATKIL